MTPDFVVVVNVLLLLSCHIGSGMPYLHIFVVDIVALLGAMTDKWMRKLVYVVRIRKYQCNQITLATKNIQTKFIRLANFWLRGLVHLACYCIVTDDPSIHFPVC